MASGAALGTSIAPGYGTAIGAVAGGLYGALQGNEAKKAREKAERAAAEIPREDPAIAGYLGDMRRHRRHLLAGTGSLFQAQRRAIDQAQAQTGANLARTTGGSTGTLIDALLRSQTQTDRSINEAFGYQQGLAADALTAQLPVISDMADRRLSLGLYGRDLAMMRAATLEQANNANFSGGLANLGSMGSLTQGAPKTSTTTQMQWDAAIPPSLMTTIPPQRQTPAPGAPNYAIGMMNTIPPSMSRPELTYTPNYR